jgi:hypothetical protein
MPRLRSPVEAADRRPGLLDDLFVAAATGRWGGLLDAFGDPAPKQPADPLLPAGHDVRSFALSVDIDRRRLFARGGPARRRSSCRGSKAQAAP